MVSSRLTMTRDYGRSLRLSNFELRFGDKVWLHSGISKIAIADQLGMSCRLGYHLLSTGMLD